MGVTQGLYKPPRRGCLVAGRNSMERPVFLTGPPQPPRVPERPPGDPPGKPGESGGMWCNVHSGGGGWGWGLACPMLAVRKTKSGSILCIILHDLAGSAPLRGFGNGN